MSHLCWKPFGVFSQHLKVHKITYKALKNLDTFHLFSSIPWFSKPQPYRSSVHGPDHTDSAFGFCQCPSSYVERSSLTSPSIISLSFPSAADFSPVPLIMPALTCAGLVFLARWGGCRSTTSLFTGDTLMPSVSPVTLQIFNELLANQLAE